MKRTKHRIPYDAPEAYSFEFEPTDTICQDSPNHAGTDLPWYPGEDDDEL